MKILLRISFLLPLAIIIGTVFHKAEAQTSPFEAPVSEGVIIYSLPSTSILLQVEAVREVYTPGPYAKYAKKYLGIDVPLDGAEKYQLTSIKLDTYLEADMTKRYVANLGGLATGATTTFFKMTSQGVIVLSDSQNGKSDLWRL